MDINNAIKIEKAAADSHFRLLPCPECGSDNVAYVQYKQGVQEPWKVSCFDCGFTLDKQAIFRHEAQVHWNKVCQGMMDKPCMNCPDRFPGCSDHCLKACFVVWKAEQQRRLKAKEHDREIDSYTIGEIRKNRRGR